MRSTTPILAAALMLTCLPSLAHEATSKTSAPASKMSGMHHASAPYDLQYLDTMTHHHQSAIDMASLAQDRASSAEIKAFAQKIISAQSEEIKQFKSWRESWYVDKPNATTMQMHGMKHSMQHMDMDKLKSASGAAFDRLFLGMMIPHHQGAIEMSRPALKKASHPEVREAARKIIEDQQKEITRMQQWLDAMKAT